MQALDALAMSVTDRLANALEASLAFERLGELDDEHVRTLQRLADELDAVAAKLQGASVKIRRHLRQRKKR